jgi:hypothetical protein
MDLSQHIARVVLRLALDYEQSLARRSLRGKTITCDHDNEK